MQFLIVFLLSQSNSFGTWVYFQVAWDVREGIVPLCTNQSISILQSYSWLKLSWDAARSPELLL